MNPSLLPFFHPRGVAVVGVSASVEKLGHGVARNLVNSGYSGAIHFVGQRQGELFGHRLYADLQHVADPVDLAVLVIPATSVPDALRACSARGIHAAIIVSAGFRESGPEGAALEQQCLAIARENEIRLLGPNCIGTMDTHLPLDTSFLQPPMPPKGGIAFISHSGAFCAAIVDWSRRQGFGFSQIASLGNQADINETDLLPVAAEDEHTRVIALYMEGVSDGVRFVQAARDVARRKPVVALKVGRFESGQQAAASHTGALAASDVAFDAAFSKAGIFRAASAEQMFDWARALENCPLPAGNRIAVLTDAGGPGVIAADALEMQGLRLAGLRESTRAALRAQLPEAASVINPVDMLASASPHDYEACLRLLIDDPGVDAALVILPPPPMYTAEAVADALIPVIQASAKPIVIALLGSELTANAFDRFNRAHVANYPFPERAASALSILFRRAESLKALAASTMQSTRPFDLVTSPGSSADELVSAYGIPTVPLVPAGSSDEATARATELGFPLVMKVASPLILHKSDVGGVLLNLANASEVTSGYAQLAEIMADKFPTAPFTGVHLQRQLPAGQDVIIGGIRDPHFGPLVMFGSGGIEAEGLKDVAFALAPLDPSEADDLLHRTWAGRRLKGFRNIPPADHAAVRDVLIRFSWLVYEHAEFSELEINPLRVLEQGVFALDIRAKL